MELNKKYALDEIDRWAEEFCAVSDEIFDRPETAYQEKTAADLLCKALSAHGFQVERGVAGIDTAFLASYGTGRPVIGILAEYDALPGMSQRAGALEPIAVEKNAPGHACGHNLLGAGALAAAVGVKSYLESSGKQGTVVCCGCPGEEGGSGKAFMARAGLFDRLDCALTWHPNDVNIVPPITTLANCQIGLKFTGVASHAAISPHLGRSALDALELTNTGIQYLREHMLPDARVHYAITNAGGLAPNVVQAEAEGLYLIRAPQAGQMQELCERVRRIAQGAALMTDTQVEETSFKAVYNVIPNHTIGKVMGANLLELGVPSYTQEERDWAQAIQSTIQRPSRLLEMAAAQMGPKGTALISPYLGKPIYDVALPYVPIQYVLPSSSDVGDVSWVCPTAQVSTATFCAGTPGHSWQLAAQGKSALAHKGMLLAGKVIAGAAIDLLNAPDILAQAQEEHRKATGGQSYQPLIPDRISPQDVVSNPD